MSRYERALRLRHVQLAGWQREVLTWGMVVVGVLLAMTGLVSPWGIVVLPAAATGLVKLQDVLADPVESAGRAFAAGSGDRDDGDGDGSDEAPVAVTGASRTSESGRDPAQRQSDAT